MKVFLKIVGSIPILLLFVSARVVQSPLSIMPLDITIGVTKNADIQSKGVCVLKLKYRDSAYHCARFSMNDDKFFAYSTPDEIINKLSFLSVAHHVLPQNWQALGLRLASSYRYRKVQSANEINSQTVENEGGNLQQEFINIITANAAKNITRKTTYSSDYQIGEIISFTVGNLHYDAEFIKWIKPAWCSKCPTYTNYDNGLVSIEVTEAFD
jgi:hypothetical protein